MEFLCVGFDVRLYPCECHPTTDYSEWEKNNAVFSMFEKKFYLDQNEYSLLSFRNQSELIEIKDFVEKSTDSDLIAIKLPREIVLKRNDVFGFFPLGAELNLSGFTCCGIDVCDINGLYSYIDDKNINYIRQRECLFDGLIPRDRIEVALEICQFANFMEPHHRPFVVAEVWSLKQSYGKPKGAE